MIQCPKCSKPTDLQRKCSHCGEVIHPTNEERFDRLGEAVENAIKKELRKRRKKRLTKFIIAILIIGIAVYVGLRI